MNIINGDSVALSREAAASGVAIYDAVITSPPYYGLRDYSGPQHADLAGLEIGTRSQSVNNYLESIAITLRNIRQACRPPATLWVIIGDSVCTKRDETLGVRVGEPLMIPHRLAVRISQYGWHLMGEIIWHKPDAMPSSRKFLTMAHESIYVFGASPEAKIDRYACREVGSTPLPTGEIPPRIMRSVWSVPTARVKARKYLPDLPPNTDFYAAFPVELAERCIALGCPPAVCPSCGKPPAREVRKRRIPTRPGISAKVGGKGKGRRDPHRHVTIAETIGWRSSCECDAGFIQAMVLDPWSGSGTTLVAAHKRGVDATGWELSPTWTRLGNERLSQHVRGSCTSRRPDPMRVVFDGGPPLEGLQCVLGFSRGEAGAACGAAEAVADVGRLAEDAHCGGGPCQVHAGEEVQ